MASENIHIKGARQHNLKNVDLTLPREKLVVITGLSGSGKSSLAFDTLYAEGQRRYVESLSAYARQFLEQMNKPDVDYIEGLSPAISIEQKNASRNPRSIVATVTEIYDYLRLLFARIGEAFCPSCGKPITAMSINQMVDRVMELPENTRFSVVAPIIRGKKGHYQKELRKLVHDGFPRVRIDGEMFDLSETDVSLDRQKKHTIEVFLDRLVMKPTIRSRLADSLELALGLAEGLATVETVSGESMTFSENFGCADCGISFPEISPRFFSFNSPFGACPECHGLGTKTYFDPELIVPDESLSLREGAVKPWHSKTGFIYQTYMRGAAEAFGFSLDTPWEKLTKKAKKIVLYGSNGVEVVFRHKDEKGRHVEWQREYEGVIPSLERRYRDTSSEYIREEFEKYMNQQQCPSCEGLRLRKEALMVRIDGRNIMDVTHFTVGQALEYFLNLHLDEKRMEIGERILKEIRERLSFLNNVGLEYLNLDRSSGTLSGGEGQRIRLATQIGSSLVGVLYILDEPSIGLHQRDNDRLLDTLKRLRDLGNTVVVVEHDEDTILAADHVVDMGPGAGVHGGEVVAQGTPDEIRKSDSLTGKYLSGALEIPVPEKRRNSDPRVVELKSCTTNNLKNLNLSLPLGRMVCVTGVSGSGKSSLVIDTLLPSLTARLRRKKRLEGCREISGIRHVDKVIAIDQSAIGRTPRSNPATYTGVFTPIRDLFAQLPESKTRGYKPGRFSFNVKGGRCESCQGDGLIKIEMHFLPDIYVTCDVCDGKRYNRETLEVRWHGKTIADVLGMTVNQNCELFRNVPSIYKKLKTLQDVGLGYIRLGQAATTLSGGEAQRIKLARELSKRSTGKTLYILDEPTTGLHFDDIRKLLGVLDRLVESGNTVVVIEHNLDVIKTADWVIDLGPEGGDGGGEIVVQGIPEDVAKCARSWTGRYLAPKLGMTPSKEKKATPKGKKTGKTPKKKIKKKPGTKTV